MELHSLKDGRKDVIVLLDDDMRVNRSLFKVKESSYQVHLLTPEEVDTFYCALQRSRDKLLFEILYLTGARIQEALNLEIKAIPRPDITETVQILRQVKSKGKYRDIYIPSALVEKIDRFILEERLLVNTDHDYIFISEQPQNLGKPLTYRGIYEVFKRIQDMTGIRFNFHDLRHTMISNLAESGMDMSIIRLIAGHEQISTTQKYTHLSDKSIVKNLARYWNQTPLIGGDLT